MISSIRLMSTIWASMAALVAVLVLGCAPQTSGNTFDPSTNTSTNSTNTIIYGPPGFNAGSLSVVDILTPTPGFVSLIWPSASNVSSYNIYVGLTATRPSSPVLTGTQATNATPITLLTNGTNFFWIEGVSANSAYTNVVLSGQPYVVKTGFRIAHEYSPPYGDGDNKNLRCLNVPLGQTRTITISNHSSSLLSNAGGAWIQTKIDEGMTNGNKFFIRYFLSNTVTAGFYLVTNAYAYQKNAYFSDWNAGPGVVSGPGSIAGTGIWVITVSNQSDADGFNSILFDHIGFWTGLDQTVGETFATLSDNDLIGDKE